MRILLSLCILLSFGATSAQKKISIEEAVLEQYGRLAPENISGFQWIEGTNSISYVENNALVIAKEPAKNGSEKMALAELNAACGTSMSRFPSITWRSKDKFTFSYQNTIYEMKLGSKNGKTLVAYPAGAANIDYHYEGRSLAYTMENNLYVHDNCGKAQVTDNPDAVVSGQAIARYEFGISKGTFWSPDGSLLAFYEKDESNVSQYPLVDYATQPASVNMIRYPMAGGPGEIAAVGIFNCKTQKTTYLELESNKKTDEFYATNLAWTPDGKHILLAIVNRDQNHMWLKEFDAENGKEIRTLFEETDDRYVEPERPTLFIPESNGDFLWFSERNGIDNIYRYDKDGTLLGQTNFNLPAKEILGFDDDGSYFYVECIAVNPTERHTFKVKLDDMSATQITAAGGAHYTDLSPSGDYLIDRWSNLDTPREIDVIDNNGQLKKNWLSAENPLSDYKAGQVEIMEIKPGNGQTYWGRLIKPQDFDPNKQYPVLVYVYNGPHAQLVENRWLGRAAMWMYSMAEEGYLVFTVEGRGSSARGFEWESAVHRNMGTVEVEDQAACAEWLKKQPYTDPDRFAVHGWSYGGFMTTSLMLKKPGLFKVGVAGGPVIDWSLYEVMYTERYMDTPQDNPEGFDNAKLTNYVSALQGDLLMIHGTSDDIVVMQHNMAFQDACIREGVLVDFYAYPGHGHNVRGKDRAHLMKKVLGYIMEKL